MNVNDLDVRIKLEHFGCNLCDYFCRTDQEKIEHYKSTHKHLFIKYGRKCSEYFTYITNKVGKHVLSVDDSHFNAWHYGKCSCGDNSEFYGVNSIFLIYQQFQRHLSTVYPRCVFCKNLITEKLPKEARNKISLITVWHNKCGKLAQVKIKEIVKSGNKNS